MVTILSRDFLPFMTAEIKHHLHQEHKLAKSNRLEQTSSTADLMGRAIAKFNYIDIAEINLRDSGKSLFQNVSWLTLK